ncbi:MAG: hypothetical protein LBE06_04485 [Azoarcus sp.]|jgi:hypothetical protein|nr:hypothetical protein [Azoarcus sp.]
MKFLAYSSILVAVLCLVCVVDAWFSPDAWGMGGFVIAAELSIGNIICLLLNYGYLKLAGGPEWLGVLVLVQLIATALFCIYLGTIFL